MSKNITLAILYMSVLLIVQFVLADNAQMTVSVQNTAPSINSITTYEAYTSSASNTQQSAFTLCSNANSKKVYIQINASDSNGYQDISSDGFVRYKIVLLNGTNESNFTRFGDLFVNASLETGNGTEVIYNASFDMLSSDQQRTAPLYYQVQAQVYDGTSQTNSTPSQGANYTFSIVSCASSSGGGGGGGGGGAAVTPSQSTSIEEEPQRPAFPSFAGFGAFARASRKTPAPQQDGSAEEPLFDIFVEIPENYRIIIPGGELLTSIKLVNIGRAGRIDVYLDYDIKDALGKLIYKKRETVAVETQASFVRIFDIPPNTRPGRYFIHARLQYFNGLYADSEASFEVVKPQPPEKSRLINALIYGFGTVLVTILLGLLIRGLRPFFARMKMRRQVRKIIKSKKQ